MMATVRHVTSSWGLRKFQADGFFFFSTECTREQSSKLQNVSRIRENLRGGGSYTAVFLELLLR